MPNALSALALVVVAVVVWQTWLKPRLAVPEAGLEVPAAPQPLDDWHLKGSSAAKVGLVVFSDFECPICATFAREVLPAITERFVTPGYVLLAFGDLPLESIHPAAAKRAAIAECAGRQGKFWEVHDRLFASPTDPEVERHASAGLNQADLSACLSSDALGVVRARLSKAEGLGIRGTPSIFVGTVQNRQLHVKEAFAGIKSVGDLSEMLERYVRQ